MSFIVGFLEGEFLPLPFFPADDGGTGASVTEADAGGDAASRADESRVFFTPRLPLVFGITFSGSFSVASGKAEVASVIMVSSAGRVEETGSGAGSGSVEGRGLELGSRMRASSLVLTSLMMHASCSQVLQCGQPNMRRSGL